MTVLDHRCVKSFACREIDGKERMGLIILSVAIARHEFWSGFSHFPYHDLHSNRKLHLLKMICHSYSIHNKMDLEIPSPPLIPFSATIRINPSFRAVENKCPSPEGDWKKSISDLKMINPLVLKLFSVSWAQQKRKQKGKIWLFAFDNTAYSSLCLTVSMVKKRAVSLEHSLWGIQGCP